MDQQGNYKFVPTFGPPEKYFRGYEVEDLEESRVEGLRALYLVSDSAAATGSSPPASSSGESGRPWRGS